MAKLLEIEFTKTYVTSENAAKAAQKLFGQSNLHFVIIPVMPGTVGNKTDSVRFGVAFLGERAVQAGVHFHFNIIG